MTVREALGIASMKLDVDVPEEARAFSIIAKILSKGTDYEGCKDLADEIDLALWG